MAESKFAGIFHNSPPDTPSPRRTKKAPAAPAPVALRPLGRPHGKRSNPDYGPVQVLLKKETHKLARRILTDLDNGQDVSELVQALLEQWVARQQKKRHDGMTA
jgi:hypothetical protein